MSLEMVATYRGKFYIKICNSPFKRSRFTSVKEKLKTKCYSEMWFHNIMEFIHCRDLLHFTNSTESKEDYPNEYPIYSVKWYGEVISSDE